MRIFVNKSRSILLAGLACLMLPVAGAPEPARANGSEAEVGEHQSVIRIRESERLPQTRAIKVGRNKATMIEMPRSLRDVMVSAPEIMDAVVQTSNRVHLIGKKVGQSNVFFFDENGEQILTLEVAVEQDTGMLDAMFRRLLPGSAIKSEILNETVILTGSVRSPVDASRATDLASRFIMSAPESNTREKAKVINLLAVEGEEQVMLKVTVAEVQRSLLKQFGINIGAELNSGNFATSLLTQNALPLTSAAGLGSLGEIGSDTALPFGTGCRAMLPTIAGTVVGNSGAAGGGFIGDSCIAHTLRALERNGLVKTLAEPNLTAVSGESAKFLAGGEYPIPTVDGDGGLGVTYKEFGVGVSFTPTVLSEGRISLKIETEVSELSNTGAVTISSISIPALKKRQANSTVELPSGGSLALAGLISEDTRQNIDGFPGLKDVPVLGTLFRSRDFVKQETELVVIVTPYMVRPTSRQALGRPLDGLADPSDRKANFLGHLNRIYGKGETAPAGDLKGDYGFIVE
ncbi:MAG: type II and III secretion system protein family protein [Hyphomicrobium sp.]